jgi:hypothetical protein
MGNGNSTHGEGQEFAALLRRFRELDGAYQSAPDAEKEKYFPRRHAAMMMLLGTPPRTRDEIAEVMSVALDELAKELMVPGPVPQAVAAALANCLRAIEHVDPDSGFPGEKRSIEPAAAVSDVPPDAVIRLGSEIAKLDKLARLLAYLAKISDGKEEQPVFFALMNSVEAIRDGLSGAVDKLMHPTMTTRRQPRTPQSS